MSDADYILLEELIKDIRFIKLHHNVDNPLVKDACWVRGDDSILYTFIKYNGKRVHAHRVSYEVFRNKKLLNYGCHHCDVPACINPFHIFDGTQKQNLWDARRKNRMYEFSLSLTPRINRAEKRLREAYSNQIIDKNINHNPIKSLSERLWKISV